MNMEWPSVRSLFNKKGGVTVPSAPTFSLDSRDDHPWRHPYLTEGNISRFRTYSEAVWQFASEYSATKHDQLSCAFAVNMAQNMYKWARLAKKYGAEAALFLHPQDNNAISSPQWEDFDGEYQPLSNVSEFLAEHPDLSPDVRTEVVQMDGSVLLRAMQPLRPISIKSIKRVAFKVGLFLKAPSVRRAALMAYPGFYPYYEWAKKLSRFDVVYAASAPFAAYASGRPYCLCSVGGDLQLDCGRGDPFGLAMLLAFKSGRFLMVSNPHTLGHSRRLGLTNGVYLPYPMDTDRYCPGPGNARQDWVDRYGAGTYILTTARIDAGVKGHTNDFFKMLIDLAKAKKNVRFLFLSWGNSATELKERIVAEGLQGQFIILPSVGKKRLIDYYRSCDIVLDQFVYGYYGATALEAASIGKPVVMHIRSEQYAPLYAGDVAPVSNASTVAEINQALTSLIEDDGLRKHEGEATRAWVVRNHGEQKTVPLMLSLLRLAADRVPLPRDLVNPLHDPLTDEEIAYHQSCLRPAT